jgi:hypothetical protein
VRCNIAVVNRVMKEGLTDKGIFGKMQKRQGSDPGTCLGEQPVHNKGQCWWVGSTAGGFDLELSGQGEQ